MNWSIYIEKLFERYDVKFDMGQRLNIMIGESGIGKSTVLRIINAAFNRDFIELSKYPFARIIIQTDKGVLEIKYEDLFQVGSDLEEVYLRMNRLEVPRNVLLANRVDVIPFMDDEIIEPYYHAPELKWFYSHDKDCYGCFSENLADEQNALLKKFYEIINFDTNFEISSGQRMFHELENQSQININKIINIASYSKEFIREINEIAAKSSLEVIVANNQKRVELNRSFFSVKVINDIENYLLPLILSDTILGKFMNEVITNENKGWLTSEYPQKLVEMFADFYTNNIENVLSDCDSKIKVFEELLNSFSTNKTYRIYPSGIKIYTINERKLKMSNLDNDINQIKLTELSSGEKKLMLILLESLFLENGLMLIDEPEQSFTILWQEKLLPTILERTGIENVIVATHSPYIVSKDDMREFLVALPMEVL